MGQMIEVALSLREEFEGRAAGYDRSGEFPTQNYDRMRETGYLRGPVPEALGGLDADLAETARAQRALAWADASTALAVNMHLFQVGGAADGWRASGANEPPLRRVAEEGIILGSTAAEAIVAGAWTTSTTAVRDGDDYLVTGRKFFASQAPAMNVARVNATDSETGEIIAIAIPTSLPGVQVIETWDTLGMRSTASHDMAFENVRVPATAVGARFSPDGPVWDPKFANVVRWFLPLMAGVYTGIADRAREEALAAVGTGINSANRDTALTNMLVGQLEGAHFRASAAHEYGLTRLAQTSDPVEGLVSAITLKDAVIDAAAEVVDLATQIAGGRSYFKKSVLERLVRDVRASAYHPPSAPISYQMVGQHLAARREAGAAVEAAEAVTAR